MELNANDKRLPEGVTDEQVTKFLRQYPGGVYPVKVRKDDQVHIGLFRKPTLVDMSAAASFGTSNPMGAGELLFNNCKLAIDPAMESDGEVRLAAITGVSKLFRVLEAEVGEPLGTGA